MRNKIIKWAIRGGLCLLILFLLFDGWVLFFFPVDTQVINIAANDNLKDISIFDLSKIKVHWLQPNDQAALATFQKLAVALDIWETAKKAQGQDKVPITLTPANQATIFKAWTSVEPSDPLAFPRQPAEPAEIQEIQQKIQNNHWKSLSEVDQSWMGTVQVQKQIFEKMLERELPLEDLIRNAKSLPMISMICSGVQDLCMQFPDLVPPEQKMTVQIANARWLQVLMRSISPNPEPLSALITMKDITFVMQKGLKQTIQSMDALKQNQQYLEAYTSINFRSTLDQWPQLPSMPVSTLKTIKSLLVMKFTESIFFQFQSSIIQSICGKNSRMYTRLKVLPLQILSIVLPQMVSYMNQLEDQLREIVTKQNMARLFIRFLDKKEKGESIDFNKITASDPFSGQSLRAEKKGDMLRLISAGYDKEFDTSDDIVWEISGVKG